MTPIASAAADPNKVLHVAIEAGDDGFDPSRSTNYYSGLIEEVIFDRLLTYDYLAEPVKLVPMLAEAMPEVADGGKTYTFHLRKGVYFTPDPAFKSDKRELVAEDVVYSIKRFLDPKNRSPWRFLFDGKIVGLNEQEALAKKNGDRFDYDAKIPGLEVVDRYTDSLPPDRHRLQLRLHTGLADEQHRRARSHRALRRRYQGVTRSARALTCWRSGNGVRASCCMPIPDIAASSGISSRPQTPGTRTSSRR